MKDVKKAFETIIESMKLPTHKTLKELIKRLESLEKLVAKSMETTKTQAKATTSKKKPTTARSVKKTAPAKKTAAKKTKKAAPKAVSGKKSATEQVLDVIRKSPKGVTEPDPCRRPLDWSTPPRKLNEDSSATISPSAIPFDIPLPCMIR